MSENASIIRSRDSLLLDEPASVVHALDRECVVFTYYLINQAPSDYVLQKYRQAHMSGNLVRLTTATQWDRLLLKLFTKHFVLMKLIDSYTSLFSRKTIVRQKLILLLAILETCAPTDECFDAESSNFSRFLLAMAQNAAGFFLALCLTVPILMPIQIILGRFQARLTDAEN